MVNFPSQGLKLLEQGSESKWKLLFLNTFGT